MKRAIRNKDVNLNGWTIDELRARVRGEQGVGNQPTPCEKDPERIGTILQWMREKGELPARD